MHSKKQPSKKEQLVRLYGSYCWWCGCCLPLEKLTREHLIPRSLGGTHSLENLRLACFPCNNSRGNSLYPPQWRKRN
ncbi:MAG: HNH endonuclease [Myxacorys chilensis ATA2-1-KO14]|nr:HNH endonuclease [Myxacorys chilensis ATA2-1-KO14]